MKTKYILTACFALLFGVGLAYWQSFDNTDNWPSNAGFKYPEPRAIDIQPLNIASLSNTSDDLLSKEFFKDKWTLIFIGYTYCPDVCPLTLTQLAELKQQTIDKHYHDKLNVLFISVDPRRDDIERLNQYTSYFSEDFFSATGEPMALEKMVNSMQMVYRVPENPEDNNYLVDHSASVVLINEQGDMYAQFRAPHNVETMIEALDTL